MVEDAREDVKLVGIMRVTQELLGDNPPDMWARLMDDRTDEQRAADRARAEADAADRRERFMAAHTAYLAAAEGAARQVLELHAPAFYDGHDGWAHCDGCDMDGYESEPPDFPCRTYALVAGIEGGRG